MSMRERSTAHAQTKKGVFLEDFLISLDFFRDFLLIS